MTIPHLRSATLSKHLVIMQITHLIQLIQCVTQSVAHYKYNLLIPGNDVSLHLHGGTCRSCSQLYISRNSICFAVSISSCWCGLGNYCRNKKNSGVLLRVCLRVICGRMRTNIGSLSSKIIDRQNGHPKLDLADLQ